MKKPIVLFINFVIIALFMLCPVFNLNKCTYALSSKNSSDVFAPNISSKSALLMDYDSGTIIFEKNSDKRLPIASMTKLASLSLIFDALSKGAIHENDLVSVTKNASSVKGSSAFLDAGSKYKVTDLIKSIVVASANDSTVALAEHVMGSEESFVLKMNKFAQSLNLKNTHFENCTGLPTENHYSSARDIAEIYKTVCNNPIYLKYSKIWMDDFIHPSGRKTGLVNTNRLIRSYEGIEGGKTGYTDSAKYCLTTSARRGNLRLIGVVIGSRDSKVRFSEMTKLLNFGFANYTNKMVVNQDLPIAKTKVKKSKTEVDIYPVRSSFKLLKKEDDQEFSAELKLNDNLKAPLFCGEKLGTLFVFDKNNMVVDEIDVTIKKDVECEKFKDGFKKIINAW